MIWKAIPGFPYEASSQGEIRNCRTGRLLKPDTVKGGYQRVTLSVAGMTTRVFVNRIVCEVFHGPAPSPDHQARHLDGKSSNNNEKNLRWGTRSENEQDKRQHGTYQEGEQNPFAKLSESQVSAIRKNYASNIEERQAEGFVQVEHGFVMALADQFGVSVSCIKFVVSRRNWKEVA